MKKILLTLMVITGIASYTFAQDGPVLTFERTSHDFGKVHEEGGPISFTFNVTNTGNKPLKIDRVQPSCGCTTPDWTKDEIPAGGKGFVKATFDPNMRVGTFNKSISVFSNANPNMTVLTFSGEVLPKPKTIEDTLPILSGNVRFANNSVSYNYIKNNVADTIQYLNIYNQFTKAITVKGITGPNYVSVATKDLPFVIQPGKMAKLPIHYNAMLNKDFGLLFDQVKIITDDPVEPEKTISVIADVHQYFAPLTDAAKLKAPKIVLESLQHDFGDLKQGETVSYEFKLSNSGKQELVIYKTKTSCGCTVSEPAKSKLKPGESTTIKVTFYSAGKNGKEQKDIRIYCNDPVTPEPVLKIMANVIIPTTDPGHN